MLLESPAGPLNLPRISTLFYILSPITFNSGVDDECLSICWHGYGAVTGSAENTASHSFVSF